MENRILVENERKIFLKYLIPSILGMLGVSAYSFVDTFVVGQGVGSQAVAAMGLGTPMVCIMYALGFLLGAGGAVNYTISVGKGDKDHARSMFSAAFYMAIILWVIIAVCGNIWIEQITAFLGATAENHDLAVEYLRWVISLSGVMILDLIMNQFMRNDGHPNVSMVATITGTVANIILDFVFVMGFGWGMSGAASATCLASVISVCITFGYAIFKKTNLIPTIRISCLKNLTGILKIGFSSFVLEISSAVISVVFLHFAGKYYGANGISAFTVLITFNLVVYSLINGVAQGMQPLVSACYAANDNKRMLKFLKYSLAASAAFGIIFFILSELLTGSLVKMLVTDSEEVLNMGIMGLNWYAFAFLFMSGSILLGIYFQAKAKPTQSLIILLGRSAVMPIILLYVMEIFIGKMSLWTAIPIAEAITLAAAVILLRKDIRSK